MILIADSGATKTDWMIISENSKTEINTQGINPFHQTIEKIEKIISNELLSKLKYCNAKEIDKIYFYGAGCLPETSSTIKDIMDRYFTNAKIEIYTDLLGAARALCKSSPGIVCILGTGANSCEYDGKNIINNIPPLGYILGDEGSGAYLGKRFIADCLKGLLPAYFKNGLYEEYKLNDKVILDNVYKEPQANRFLASITPYIFKYKSDEHIRTFLKECFKEFFNRNLKSYNKKLKVSFTGSIAWFFKEEIIETAEELRYEIGVFIKNPINGLAEFHCK